VVVRFITVTAASVPQRGQTGGDTRFGLRRSTAAISVTVIAPPCPHRIADVRDERANTVCKSCNNADATRELDV